MGKINKKINFFIECFCLIWLLNHIMIIFYYTYFYFTFSKFIFQVIPCKSQMCQMKGYLIKSFLVSPFSSCETFMDFENWTRDVPMTTKLKRYLSGLGHWFSWREGHVHTWNEILIGVQWEESTLLSCSWWQRRNNHRQWLWTGIIFPSKRNNPRPLNLATSTASRVV